MLRTDRAATAAERRDGRGARASHQISTSARLQISLFLLGVLLLYLLVRQVFDPGFSEYWGYSVVQLIAATGLIIALSVFLADRGGISLLSQTLIVLTVYADTLGTAEDFYHRFSSYDKIIHTLGSAAVASTVGDVLLALSERNKISWSPKKMMLVAIGIAISVGVLWEVYEYVGDTILNTGRHISATDTEFDLASDTVGGIAGGLIFYWLNFRSSSQLAPSPTIRTTADGREETARRRETAPK